MDKRILAVALCAALTVAATAAEQHGHWGYAGHGNPDHWAELDKGFEACKLGKEQSPVDIRTAAVEKAELPPIKAGYKMSLAELVNNGHTIQVNLAEGGAASLANGDYKLVQFHFHTPSEEKIDGKSFPLVAHLVHKNDAGNLAVVAVLFRQGAENAALKDVFAQLPEHKSTALLQNGFDAGALLPSSLGYYAFKGSLTTPPCSEGVSWHVLKQPVDMSAKQIAAFQHVFHMNARPVQPLNGRKVLASN